MEWYHLVIGFLSFVSLSFLVTIILMVNHIDHLRSLINKLEIDIRHK